VHFTSRRKDKKEKGRVLNYVTHALESVLPNIFSTRQATDIKG
jgi:hypothetical protein